jgi:L-amino acid N-acyltransferase YncA
MAVNFTIEEAKVADLDQIKEIYAHYVKSSTASLEEKAPNSDEILDLYSTVMGKNLPFLVARSAGKVIGYCYAQPYRKRSAYRFTVEESIYVHKDYLRNGIGAELLSAVIKKCKEIGFKQVVANVVYSGNEDSVEFHESMGFVERGRLIGVGFKFNQWLDTVLMQKEL